MAKQILIFGAGAIGAITAAYLDRAGVEFALVDPWFQNVEEIRKSGLRMRRLQDDFIAHPRTLHVDQLGTLDRRIDVFVLSMKSYDTEWVARLVAPYLAPDAYVLSAQNGINEERIAAILGRERVIGCVVAMSGFLERAADALGTTPRTSEAFVLGEIDGGMTPRVHELATLLAPVGRVTESGDIWSALWAKLLLNVMTNALAGLTKLNTPDLWSDRAMVEVMSQLGGEAVLVAEKMGRSVGDLTPPGMPAGMALTARALRAAHAGDPVAAAEVATCFAATAEGRKGGGEEGKASLLQDLIRGRRTEVDYLNGYIVENGERRGVPTPINRAITNAVHEVERGRTMSGSREVAELLKVPALAR